MMECAVDVNLLCEENCHCINLTSLFSKNVTRTTFGCYIVIIKPCGGGFCSFTKLTMDFYNGIGKNSLSNITNELVLSSIKDDLKLVLSEHFKIIWFGKLT